MKYYIKKGNGQVFAGYGQTMSKPLWFIPGIATRVILFETKQAALDETERLRNWINATENLYVEKV